MPKINVYLPDSLADAVREAGVPVSAICQRALEQAVRRITAIRQTVLSDLDPAQLASRLPHFTPRTVAVLSLATERARDTAASAVTSGHLLHGMLAEGGNMALQILGAMEIDPASITVPDGAEPGGEGEGLRFSSPAANAVELAVTEATSMGHNYVGCEHLLVGLSAEPDGLAGRVLGDRGADARATRRAVAAAMAGYAHLRASAPTPAATAGLLTAVRAELAPLIRRIEALEASRP
ncbi:Clp protease N-terminal domain-containing protein [Couchioplanes caeruleus]|uniref:Peptidase n=2 Tax=Couchioplanes caeruleus TaxID=56438 RepID=A0A1K0G354_9ACTN|nr:Clp protease N-terminal domain-containing protein [Couchioplanes caeruleus]OJF11722.1 peptidase [Couchioplanes caeruleus subsp. caeruleus]ROP33286.1 ATP-dependent Clp protease ATP-binding subunit ClpC [Couchioplanes caeruleus]